MRVGFIFFLIMGFGVRARFHLAPEKQEEEEEEEPNHGTTSRSHDDERWDKTEMARCTPVRKLLEWKNSFALRTSSR